MEFLKSTKLINDIDQIVDNFDQFLKTYEELITNAKEYKKKSKSN